jgi:hypothetical protein
MKEMKDELQLMNKGEEHPRVEIAACADAPAASTPDAAPEGGGLQHHHPGVDLSPAQDVPLEDELVLSQLIQMYPIPRTVP